MLSVDDVSFAYRDAEVLRHVSLAVDRGTMLGLIGPNGAGKTTLLSVLAGTLAPSRGRVSVDGVDLARVPRGRIARRIAVVPQQTQLAFDYRVLEIALMGRYPHLGPFTLEGPEDVGCARRALRATGTAHLESRSFSTLSGGEKQRVIIASALSQLGIDGERRPHERGDPEAAFLLLDEPTASLDLRYHLEIAAILERLHAGGRLGIVLSTHDLSLAASLCDRMVLLQEGRVAAAGPSTDVLTSDHLRTVYGVEVEVRSDGSLAGRSAMPVVRARGLATGTGASSERRTSTASPAAETPGGAPGLVLRRRVASIWLGFGIVTIAVCLAAPFVGTTPIAIARVFDRATPFADNLDAQIFFVARLPRALAGAFVGAALAASGVVFQALLGNPLASPFTLGISAGASLGALLAITTAVPIGIAGIGSVPIASLLGSIGAAAIVYALTRARRQGFSTTVLLLAGVTLNSFFSAIIIFVQYLADFADTLRAVRWLMGDLDVSGYEPFVAALPPAAAALAIFAWLPRPLNLLALGSEGAATRGVDVVRSQRLAFLSASLATGAAVSLGGPIGFVGIVVPHLVRMMVGADHRLVLPASALFGGAFLVLCDVVARTAMAPVELPVGVITALLGGPFFLWLLLRHR